MVSHLLFDELLLFGLLWVCVLSYWVWPRRCVAPCQSTPMRDKRATRRPQDPKTFPGTPTSPTVTPVSRPQRLVIQPYLSRQPS
jgi:hypothetical protein